MPQLTEFEKEFFEKLVQDAFDKYLHTGSCGHKLFSEGHWLYVDGKAGTYCDACAAALFKDDKVKLSAAMFTIKQMVMKGQYFKIASFVKKTLDKCVKFMVDGKPREHDHKRVE